MFNQDDPDAGGCTEDLAIFGYIAAVLFAAVTILGALVVIVSR